MAAPPAPHCLTLPGDFIFIYKQDENPSSINLGEQKMEKKGGAEGAGEHPGEEEVGRASVHHVPRGGGVSVAARLFLLAPWQAARQQRGLCSDFGTSPGALSGC